jgi:maleylacetate reductase
LAIEKFTYTPLAIKVCFGNGRFQELGNIASDYQLNRILVLSTDSDRAKALAEKAGAQLEGRLVGYFDGCLEQVPTDNARKVQALADHLDVDGVVCVGGGSTIGHGKAVALTREIKLIHVVTTYSGSEMTISQGFQQDGVKRHTHDARMQADCVIYDPELTTSLPASVSGPSGMNAMAHSVEALYGNYANPISNLLAMSGISALATALPKVVKNPNDLNARGDALYGAYMSGVSLSAGMALHHQVAHVLGGSFAIPHAIAHTLALPHTIAYNRQAVPMAMDQLARSLTSEDGPTGLYDLSCSLDINMRLSDYGFDAQHIDHAISLILDDPKDNPRPLERSALHTMFADIVAGTTPRIK